MNSLALTHTAVEPIAPPPVPQNRREACHAVSGDELQRQEADRLFEARLQWFLAVSRAA